ncbi:MAG: hypothetical protein AAGD38_23470, partial [Acidobacteriota bacterium]
PASASAEAATASNIRTAFRPYLDAMRAEGERQDVFRRVVEIYKEKERGGFFRRKQSLEVIRTELRIESFEWEST